MKTSFYTLINIVSLMLMLSSCTKEGTKGCGGEDKDEASHCIFKDALGFKNYYNGVEDSSAVYRTNFETDLKKSFFDLQITLKGYCIYDPLIIYSHIAFKQHLPEVQDTLFITEVSPNFATLSKVQQVIYTSYSEYYITVPFIVEGDGGTTVINNHVTFPYQGSGNKDSLFFFSNLEKMELSALFKRK